LDEVLKDHLTLTDKTIAVIEKAILSGSMKNGERIVETEIAKRLGISKAPVREALKKLEGDGIVELLPRRGYIVKPVTLKSTNDFFDVQFLFEPAAAKLALRKKNDAICQEMTRIIEAMERSLETEDYDAYLHLNEAFHTLFYRSIENEWFIKISQMLRKQARILRSLSLFTRDRFTTSIKEHMAIAEAYRKGDAKALVSATKLHLELFKKNILESEFLKREKTELDRPEGERLI
jgi:DNA-binding GntR family transcriptional regulator